MAAVVGVVALSVLLTGLLAGVSILRGWVLSVIWGWFMVPLGAPAIGIAAAIGVALIGHMVAGSWQPTREQTKEEKQADMFRIFFNPLMTLGIAWVVKQFMA